jgi:cobalt/nickel transport system ATP-binding protein
MLELDRVVFGWPGGAPVLQGLSLSVQAGERLVVLGANGCGKSTLLKLMNGLVAAQDGQVRFEGARIDPATLAADRTLARRFRQRCVLPTVRDEIAYGPAQLNLPDVDARVARWADALQLTPLLDQAPFGLSGGQKQKLALACLLALDPPLLLLDEASASLDPAAVGWLIDHLLDTPHTVVACTHNLSLAAELGNRCLVLGSDGQPLFDGPVANALDDLALMHAAGLAHRHRHGHSGHRHSHLHTHDWDAAPRRPCP